MWKRFQAPQMSEYGPGLEDLYYVQHLNKIQKHLQKLLMELSEEDHREWRIWKRLSQQLKIFKEKLLIWKILSRRQRQRQESGWEQEQGSALPLYQTQWRESNHQAGRGPGSGGELISGQLISESMIQLSIHSNSKRDDKQIWWWYCSRYKCCFEIY